MKTFLNTLSRLPSFRCKSLKAICVLFGVEYLPVSVHPRAYHVDYYKLYVRTLAPAEEMQEQRPAKRQRVEDP